MNLFTVVTKRRSKISNLYPLVDRSYLLLVHWAPFHTIPAAASMVYYFCCLSLSLLVDGGKCIQFGSALSIAMIVCFVYKRAVLPARCFFQGIWALPSNHEFSAPAINRQKSKYVIISMYNMYINLLLLLLSKPYHMCAIWREKHRAIRNASQRVVFSFKLSMVSFFSCLLQIAIWMDSFIFYFHFFFR